MQRLFHVNLDELTEHYYSEASSAFAARGAEVIMDIGEDPKNPLMRVRKGRNRLLIPANKNRVWINGREQVTPSLNVYNGRHFYVSEMVLNLLD